MKQQLLDMLQRGAYEFQVQDVVKWVGKSQQKMNCLIDIMMHEKESLALRAAWALSHVGETAPRLALPHLPALVDLIRRPNLHNGFVRSTLRLLQFAEIPEDLHGPVMNSCFRFIEEPKEKPAIKANAMTILHNLSKQYPEILPEIKAIIAERMDTETAAFRGRAKIFFK
ncbi:MAG TPA: hypothetical protein VLC98_14245 [Phnomibacter sp.]|nr:hypothetical protein [Phnomibacter sp.]